MEGKQGEKTSRRLWAPRSLPGPPGNAGPRLLQSKPCLAAPISLSASETSSRGSRHHKSWLSADYGSWLPGIRCFWNGLAGIEGLAEGCDGLQAATLKTRAKPTFRCHPERRRAWHQVDFAGPSQSYCRAMDFKMEGRDEGASGATSRCNNLLARLLHRSTHKSTKPSSKPLAQPALKIPIYHP